MLYIPLPLPQLHGHFATPRRCLPTGTARQNMIYLIWHVNGVTTYQGGLSYGGLQRNYQICRLEQENEELREKNKELKSQLCINSPQNGRKI